MGQLAWNDKMEPTNSTPPKFSRYRSVRHKNSTSEAKAINEEPPPVPVSSQSPGEVKRAPSRYRRYGSKSNIQDAPALPTHPLPQCPPKANGTPKTFVLSYEDRVQREHVRSPQREKIDGARDRTNTTDNAHATSSRQGHSNHSKSDPSARPPTAARSYEAAREEARMILEGEFDRMQKLKQTQGSQAPDMSRRRNTIKEERPQPKQKEPVPPKPVKQVSPPPPPPEPIKEEPEPLASPSRRFRQFIIGGNGNGNGNGPPKHKRQESKPPEIIPLPQVDAPQLHKAEVHKLVEPALGFDAPVSAVNAGDRRVEIRCNSAAITLPVTPSTTVKDLLNSASVVMSENVDPKTAIVLESFSQLALERPLRRYERIRDVMNSWETDTQNYLSIMPASECDAVGLELKDAPTMQPQNIMVQMYHSPRPGYWSKKYLKLREDGQVSISNKENHLESTNICHLSDFDLYTPTGKQRKTIKPPKKICFAVKSQQKSAMFLNGENFAHFFCSSSKDISDKWYRAVWDWRSWYLVDVLGEGGKKAPPLAHTKQLSLDIGFRPSTSGSTGTVPYQLGSFKPLLDFGELRLSTDDDAKEYRPLTRNGSVDIRRKPSIDISSPPPKRTGTSRGGVPPSSFPRRLVKDATNLDPYDSSQHDDDQAFTGKGLLASHASAKSQGGRGSGRGVQGKSGQPLVDLSEQSEFADGSLLRQLEAWKVANGEGEGVKIDREKRVERDVKVGEGY